MANSRSTTPTTRRYHGRAAMRAGVTGWLFWMMLSISSSSDSMAGMRYSSSPHSKCSWKLRKSMFTEPTKAASRSTITVLPWIRPGV